MPKNWLYYLALLLPLAASGVIFYTGFVEWLWYHGHPDAYYFFSKLRVDPVFVGLLGGWPLAFFTGTVLYYWYADDDGDKDIGSLFLLLPLAYVPFAVIGTILATREINIAILYSYPLVVIIGGYLYVMPWAFCVRMLEKFGVVV